MGRGSGSALRTWLALALFAGCSSNTIIVGPDGGPVSSGSGSSNGSSGSVSGSGRGATASGSGSIGGGSGSGSSSGVPTNDSGAGGSSSGSASSSSGSSGSSDGGSSGSSGGPGDGGGGPDAGCNPPPTLMPNPPGVLQCGPADGGTLECTASSGSGVCCLGGPVGGGTYLPDFCRPNPADCSVNLPDSGSALPIECWQVADCTASGIGGAQSCCIQGATPPTRFPGCSYLRSKGGTGVMCETTAACPMGSVQVCSSQADCPAGTTCQAGYWKIFDVGFCL